MRIESVADQSISAGARTAIARYRHRVFVQGLKWDLPCEEDYEQDEFDTAGATHLVALDEGEVVGYARLLPTSQPYLLATHFAHLLGGASPPSCPSVWELSRFTSSSGDDGGLRGREAQTRVGKRLLLEAVRFASERGARQLVCCTTVAVERLAMRWGVDIHRLGAPVRWSGGLLVGACIQCSEQTLQALGSETPHFAVMARGAAPAPAPVTLA